MRAACLFVLLSPSIFAAPETVLQADRIEGLLVLNAVYLNNQGPYRMMIDTGNNSSALRPALARRLGLRPAYRVQAQTTAGAKTVPVALLEDMRVGPLRENGVEIMIMDLQVPGVDGVLGQSWLARHDYLLDHRRRRLTVDLVAPPAGLSVPLRAGDGRPQVSAEVNGCRQDLVVDSGTSVLVLFRQTTSAATATLVTNIGSVRAGSGSARITIGSIYNRRLNTLEVDASQQPGLLPVSAFRSVYISNRHGIVVFVP